MYLPLHAKSSAAHVLCAPFRLHAVQYELSAQLLLHNTRLPICKQCNITTYGALSLQIIVPSHSGWALTSCPLFTAVAVL